MTKTAAGAYDERHEWDVEKSVTPLSQDVLAGKTGDFTWTVTVTESVFEENFAVTGSINIKNPRTDATMVVSLIDVINDGLVATITGCTVGTWNGTSKTVSIPANTTAVCAYTVSPTRRTATLNTATVGLNGLTTTATANVGWTSNVIRGSATLTDNQNPAFPINITDGGTWTYPDSYTCSTNQGDYTNGSYTHPESNIAIITSGNERDRDTANTVRVVGRDAKCKLVEGGFSEDDSSSLFQLFYSISILFGFPLSEYLRATRRPDALGIEVVFYCNRHPMKRSLEFLFLGKLIQLLC